MYCINGCRRNGRTGQELHRREKPVSGNRNPIRTQRTKLQSALLAHVPPGIIELNKRLSNIVDKGQEGVDLAFEDGTEVTADLVVGADGIRSVSCSTGDYGTSCAYRN